MDVAAAEPPLDTVVAELRPAGASARITAIRLLARRQLQSRRPRMGRIQRLLSARLVRQTGRSALLRLLNGADTP